MHEGKVATVDERRLQGALMLVEQTVSRGQVGAAVAAVALGDELLVEQACGYAGWSPEEPPLAPSAPFLVASLTKPVVCAGAMLLVQDSELALDDPVCHYAPNFGRHGKQGITLRHLMTHTSGLPDQLEENIPLRQQHAGLDRFIHSVCELQPLFAPGSHVHYQSMGLLMLGHVIEQVTGLPLRVFLRGRALRQRARQRFTGGDAE